VVIPNTFKGERFETVFRHPHLSSFSRLQAFRPWRLIRDYPHPHLCDVMQQLTANLSHKQWNDWGSPMSTAAEN
jgi:hypothetical protein